MTVSYKNQCYVYIIVTATVPLKCKLTLNPRYSRESRLENRVENRDLILHTRFSRDSLKRNILDYAYSIQVSRKRLIPRRKNNSRFCKCRPYTKGCKRCDRIICRSVSLNEISLLRQCVCSPVKVNNLLSYSFLQLN